MIFGSPHGVLPLYKDHTRYLTKTADRSNLIKVHEFTMGDVDDLEIYVAQPIWEWQQTEHGNWCMDHVEDLKWEWNADMHQYGYVISIWGKMSDEDLTYYMLKWGKR